jgi:hypothetical protein
MFTGSEIHMIFIASKCFAGFRDLIFNDLITTEIDLSSLMAQHTSPVASYEK